MEKIENNDYCSFCGGHIQSLVQNEQVEVFESINQINVICSNCISSYADKLDEEEETETPEINFNLTPMDIVNEFNKIIIGQEDAKRSLALAAYQHYQRIQSEQELDKTNILLVGPTGSGKTLLAKTLAKALNVPYHIVRANSITETGYVGDDVESIVEGLLEKANGDPKLAEMGIVFIDEIDKIAKTSSPGVKDVSGLGVQNSLLTILEDEDVVAYKKSEFMPSVTVNTKNILFIASGAFSGISEIANTRKNKNGTGIGFTALKEKAVADQQFKMGELLNEDFISFGLVPEFVGRFPVITSLSGLSESDIERIIVEPQNSILKQYETLFANENTTLVIEDGVFNEIAEIVLRNKTGARGLKGVFNNLFANALFDATTNKKPKICTITKNDVITGQKAQLKLKQRNRTAKA